ncbi:hypothetical protein KPH14_006386 [Odynerus spinipes]|uniref:Uncharacterized protein n=1 Tax=Odynerus spinipes TaxID=1348599 RepID=A0AAD9VWF0_9HYME|nr:hypothetical protein KPH14_006386 [Odynerus spinipes]
MGGKDRSNRESTTTGTPWHAEAIPFCQGKYQRQIPLRRDSYRTPENVRGDSSNPKKEETTGLGEMSDRELRVEEDSLNGQLNERRAIITLAKVARAVVDAMEAGIS